MTVIINGTNGITSVNGTAAAPSVTGTDTDTGIVYGTNTLSLATGGTTGMTMDSSQNVGIGTATPAAKLNVNNGFLQVDISGTQAVRVGSSDSIVGGTDNNGILQTNTSKALLFYAGGSERMRINATAPILCLSGGSTTATGTGIAFPATQSASTDANTLDDYEEGTFTPTVAFASGSGATFNNRSAQYTKIGRIVFVQYNVFFSGLGTSSGTLTLGGLPFATIGDTYLGRFTGAAFLDRMTNGFPFGVGASATTFTITTIPNGAGSASDLTAANLTATSYLTVNFSYIIS